MSKVGWKIKKRVRFSDPLEQLPVETDSMDINTIDTYESMLGNAVDYDVNHIPLPKIIYERKVDEITQNFDTVRYVLDFMDDFFPWNRRWCLLVFIWGLCGMYWGGSFESQLTWKKSLCGFIFIIGSVVGVSHILLDAGGSWVRNYVERNQYMRWSKARRIQVSIMKKIEKSRIASE